MKQHAPATARNREPIRDVLARVLPSAGDVLEIASGSGEHALFFARAFPQLAWQPSDTNDDAIASIAAWRAEDAPSNLRAPIVLDASANVWPHVHADAIVCINMIHIAPWQAALGLAAGAARTLASGALLFLYGPYIVDGETAPSNREFDRSLRARNSHWGVRELREVEAAARDFVLAETVAMPANNLSLIFRRA
jgi:hypothetical protein